MYYKISKALKNLKIIILCSDSVIKHCKYWSISVSDNLQISHEAPDTNRRREEYGYGKDMLMYKQYYFQANKNKFKLNRK